jgi:hypothetical protein
MCFVFSHCALAVTALCSRCDLVIFSLCWLYSHCVLSLFSYHTVSSHRVLSLCSLTVLILCVSSPLCSHTVCVLTLCVFSHCSLTVFSRSLTALTLCSQVQRVTACHRVHANGECGGQLRKQQKTRMPHSLPSSRCAPIVNLLTNSLALSRTNSRTSRTLSH